MMKTFLNKEPVARIIRFFDDLARLQIPILASSACYFLALAVFPALVLLISLIRYTPLDITTIFAVMEGILPDALMPYAQNLILSTYNNASGALISLSAFTALWSASRGIHGLLTGLNVIYDVVEDRNFFLTRIISVGYTFAFIVVLLLTLVLHVFGTTILDMLPHSDHPLITFIADVVDLRFFVLLAIQTALFTAMFMVFPNRRNKAADSLPGALLASIGWLTFSDIFSIYVENFTRYSNIYGSVYAVALSMLWLYFCISIFFYGGALNQALMRREKQEKE
jgi:membrane protein